MIPASTKLPYNIGMSLDGTKEITDLFKGKVFSYPKTSGMATDSVMTNFEQIFETYSPKTVRRVL